MQLAIENETFCHSPCPFTTTTEALILWEKHYGFDPLQLTLGNFILNMNMLPPQITQRILDLRRVGGPHSRIFCGFVIIEMAHTVAIFPMAATMYKKKWGAISKFYLKFQKKKKGGFMIISRPWGDPIYLVLPLSPYNGFTF